MTLRRWTIFIVICPIVQGSFIIRNDDLNIKYDITFPNHCQGTTHTIAHYKDIRIADCVTKCALRPHCEALNYHAGMSLCELFKHVEENYTNNKCTHIQRKHIKVDESPCGKACEVGSSCDLKTKYCKIKECLDFPEIVNGKVLGNRKEVGRKVSVKCLRGFKHKGDIKQSFCTDEGLWNPHIECMSVECNQLSIPDNVSVISTNGTQMYSVTKYVCNNGYIGTEQYWIRRCEANGIWSGTEPKCSLVECDRLVYPENTTMISNNGTHFGSVYEFTCKPGYVGSEETWTFKCDANGNWNEPEVTCVPAERVVCDDGWEIFKLQCYYIFFYGMNFEAAEKFCKSHGGHLVSIRSVAEKDFVLSHVREHPGTKFWIGLTDEEVEDIWIWIDTDEPADYFDWKEFQPNEGRDANCVSIWAKTDYQWVDEPCTEEFLPICKKQIM